MPLTANDAVSANGHAEIKSCSCRSLIPVCVAADGIGNPFSFFRARSRENDAKWKAGEGEGERNESANGQLLELAA